MKPAHPIAVASLLLAAIVFAGSARAQSIPEVPISTGPHSVAPALEPAADWGAAASLPLLPVFTGGALAPVLPAWLSPWQWLAKEWPAAARERSSRIVIRERDRAGRQGPR
jgi:hypothetical protein